ncbi:MerR family transcriptional regulator [Novosphingobium aquiterrae]|uniref:MerR family transcriptional regulator n=1 Tax=Novosphingobium aquiterrae TaxID=624388 RepID=A0ABV6PLK0_9SPHN
MSADAQYSDGKDPEALRTIGEVAKALGIRQHVLRYWEEQFPMLRPLKRSGGRRYYRPEDVQLVETIHRLVHKQGYTLKGAKNALSGATASDPSPVRSAGSDAASAVSASGGMSNANFALRARLIALRTTLVSALHES